MYTKTIGFHGILFPWYLVPILLFQDATAHSNLGVNLHSNGFFKEAETEYLKSLEIKSDDEKVKSYLLKAREKIKEEER